MSDDTEWANAVRAAAKGLREGNEALGHSLAHRLCFGKPLSTQERVDLARLVTDKLLPERNGRPAGEIHRYNVQLMAAIEYTDRMRDPKRTMKSDELKAAIGSPLGVSAKLVGKWVTEYRRTIRQIDEYHEALRARLEGDDPERAGKYVDPLRTGEAVLRQQALINSK